MSYECTKKIRFYERRTCATSGYGTTLTALLLLSCHEKILKKNGLMMSTSSTKNTSSKKN
jgi:hypothetical protein